MAVVIYAASCMPLLVCLHCLEELELHDFDEETEKMATKLDHKL